MNQAELTRYLNFEYYMVSSPREIEAFSKQPVYLEPEVYGQMIGKSQILYNLVQRLVAQILEKPLDCPSYILPDFIFREQILNLPLDFPPLFWARYDAFERAEGGIFFSEFNYDKPCAQREIMVSNWMNPEGNPNQLFAKKFKQGLIRLWKEYGSGKDQPTVGILFDPNHYEENHLAYLYADLIEPLGYHCLLLGGQNLIVTNDTATAFGKPIDIILRQYPTEFSYEIHHYSKLLNLAAERKILILNDPRSIIPQAKSLFALLWDLYYDKESLLTDAERCVILDTIPYTRMFTHADLPELLSHKDSWVIKPVFGRYSEGVYIGAMMNQEEWQNCSQEVIQNGIPYVMQKFIPIKRRIVSAFNYNRYEDTVGFGNFGIYFTMGEFTGVCARWSSDYLSRDDMSWFSPVGVRHQAAISSIKLRLSSRSDSEHQRLWNDIAMQAAFQFNYTASYTGEWESFNLEPMLISRTIYDETANATEELSKVFIRTRNLLQENLYLFGPILGISELLYPLLEHDKGEWLSFLARFDWALDCQGNLRLLELNTDTPAGLESVCLNCLIHPFCPDTEDPNRELLNLLRTQSAKLLNKTKQESKTLGLVGCPSAEEDWFQLMMIGEALKTQFNEVVLGDISGLALTDGHLNLYGRRLDALYRHYPMDWLAEDHVYQRLLRGFEEFQVLNPPSALIPQSKAFLAIVYELLQQGFYTAEEAQLIHRYVVPTYLVHPQEPCVVKPYWGREGQGVIFSDQYKAKALPHLAKEDVVYQKVVDINPIDVTLRNTYEKHFTVAYPILGAFLAGDKFGGLYSRLGARITNRYAVVAPTFVEVS